MNGAIQQCLYSQTGVNGTCDEGYTNPSLLLMNESIGKRTYLEVVQTEAKEKDREESSEPKELQMGSIAS